jgi:flagellar hook-basal body complex protein FliE
MNIIPVQPSTISGIQQAGTGSRPAAAPAQVTQTFEQALQALGQSQSDSDGLLEQLASGENVDLHQVMIATEQTDINFRIAIAIRDRLVEAYREVTRMTV